MLITRILDPHRFSPEAMARIATEKYPSFGPDAVTPIPWAMLDPAMQKAYTDLYEYILSRLIEDGVLGY